MARHVRAIEKKDRSVVDATGQHFLTYVYDDDPVAAEALVQIIASDGQSVQYAPMFGYPETAATYSDGTSATYAYTTSTYVQKDSGLILDALVLETAQDTRAEGPMQSIKYSYADAVPAKFSGQVAAEQHYPDGIPVSSFTSDDARTTGTDTRGDGPSRVLFMEKIGKTPLLQWREDFNNVKENFHYDAYKYLDTYTDRGGAPTLYDNEFILGRPLTITHPDALDGNGPTTMVYHYSFDGVPDDAENPYYVYSVKDDNDHTTFYDRDTLNRITQIRYPDGGTETFEYNSFAQVTKHKRQNGYYDHAEYDSTGLLQTLWSPTLSATRPSNGPKTTFTYYDENSPWHDRVKDMTDPKGAFPGDPTHSLTYEYDKSFDASGVQTGTACSGRGLVTKIINPLTAADNGVRSFKTITYTRFGDKASETDETGRQTTYTYDDYRRLKTMTEPGQAPTSYDYTATGGQNPYSHTSKSWTTQTSPSGVVTTRTYDANLRVSRETAASGSAVAATTSYGYDANGNQTSVTDPRGNAGYPGYYNTTIAYDSRNRKTRETSPAPLNYMTSWGYDPVGNVTSISRPDGGVESKTYDEMNRVWTDTMPKGRAPAATFSTVTFTYNYSGTMATVKDGKDNLTTIQYNTNPDGLINGFDL